MPRPRAPRRLRRRPIPTIAPLDMNPPRLSAGLQVGALIPCRALRLRGCHRPRDMSIFLTDSSSRGLRAGSHGCMIFGGTDLQVQVYLRAYAYTEPRSGDGHENAPGRPKARPAGPGFISADRTTSKCRCRHPYLGRWTPRESALRLDLAYCPPSSVRKLTRSTVITSSKRGSGLTRSARLVSHWRSASLMMSGGKKSPAFRRRSRSGASLSVKPGPPRGYRRSSSVAHTARAELCPGQESRNRSLRAQEGEQAPPGWYPSLRSSTPGV